MNNDASSKDGITMIKRESLLCVYIDTRVCVLKSGKIIISDLELAFHLRPLTLTGEKRKKYEYEQTKSTNRESVDLSTW